MGAACLFPRPEDERHAAWLWARIGAGKRVTPGVFGLVEPIPTVAALSE